MSPLVSFRDPARVDRIALEDRTGVHSYRSLREHATRVSARLTRHLVPGDRVALLAGRHAHFVGGLFGILESGGVALVLSPEHPSEEMRYQCHDAKIRAILASPECLEQARALALPSLVLSTDAPEADAHAPRSFQGDEPALQLYTSGTTGKPKGAVLSHKNLKIQMDLLREAWGFSENDVLLHTLPLHHMHGLVIAFLTALGAGARTRLLPAFDAREVFCAMRDSSVFMAVPTMYHKLLAAYDAASPEEREAWGQGAKGLRLSTSGSAALPVSIGERWRALSGSYPLERFGMTEIGVGATNPLVGERIPGSVGRPLPTVEVHIEGDSAQEGELWIAGPSVFQGYFEREDATREAFVERDGVRWFRTGDTARLEANGTLRILGRTSVDILKSGGYKLSALEIEEVLRAHPEVSEVSVVGLPDEIWGQRVVACVVLRDGSLAHGFSDRIKEHARSKLAIYKVPKTFMIVQELPKNALGKVIKPELVRRLAG